MLYEILGGIFPQLRKGGYEVAMPETYYGRSEREDEDERGNPIMSEDDDHDCHLDMNGEGHCSHPSHKGD